MIKIEFPAGRPDIARVMGEALIRVAETNVATERKETYGELTPSLSAEDARQLAEDLTEEAPKHTASTADAFTPSQPEGTEAEPTGTAPTAEPDLSAHSTSGAPVDTKGVAFDANYCGQAKDPYYATGKRSGQWKKRKGVEDADYDAWYASQLGDSAPTPEVNTSAAFGATTEATAQEETSAPTTTGEFMGWVSELQAAGRLTQEHVNQAYAANGLGINALFPPNTEEQIAANIAKLYEALSHAAA